MGLRPSIAVLAAICLASAATLVTLGSRLTFFNDEWYVLLLRPGVSADTLLEPHNGHLTVLPIAVYKVLVALFGLDDQLPFRLVLAAVVVSLGTLVFAFVRERCGDVLGLLAAAAVLFLGPAWQDLLWSFQIGLVGSLAAGVGVLLALERGSRRADVIACALLVVSIALSNLGTSFIIAAAIVVVQRRRLSDAWIPGVPAALFAAWWLAYGRGAETGFSLENVARTPFYVLDSMAAALSSLAGLSTDIAGNHDAYAWGRPLLVLVAVGFAAWVARGRRPAPGAAPIAAAALSFWALLGFDFIPNWREPDTSRYQLISVTLLILLAAELFRPVRLRPAALAVVAGVAVISIGSNLGALRDGYQFFRDDSAVARADLGALDIGREHIPAKFRLLQPIAGSIYMTGIYAGPYYRERDAHGSPAYAAAEIAAAPPRARSAADVVLASGYSLRLEPMSGPAAASGESCQRLGLGEEVELAVGGATVHNPGPVSTRARLRRFADDFPADLGDLAPRRSALVRVPSDGLKRPWRLSVEGAAVRVCSAISVQTPASPGH